MTAVTDDWTCLDPGLCLHGATHFLSMSSNGRDGAASATDVRAYLDVRPGLHQLLPPFLMIGPALTLVFACMERLTSFRCRPKAEQVWDCAGYQFWSAGPTFTIVFTFTGSPLVTVSPAARAALVRSEVQRFAFYSTLGPSA